MKRKISMTVKNPILYLKFIFIHSVYWMVINRNKYLKNILKPVLVFIGINMNLQHVHIKMMVWLFTYRSALLSQINKTVSTRKYFKLYYFKTQPIRGITWLMMNEPIYEINMSQTKNIHKSHTICFNIIYESHDYIL